jgi:flagellin-like protein
LKKRSEAFERVLRLREGEKPGISELLGTLTMVAITLITGAAVSGLTNSTVKPRSKSRWRSPRFKRRMAISEMLGTLLMVAVTLIAGAAVIGFVNGQSSSSSAAVGGVAASNINFLNEREEIITAAMVGGNTCPASSSLCSSSAEIWVYNSGLISPENITSVVVYNTASPADLCTISLYGLPSPPPNLIDKGEVSPPIPITIPPSPGTAICPNTLPFYFQSGQSYTFEVVGEFGSSAQLTVGF